MSRIDDAPLRGLRVLDCSRFLPGAYFGWIAADLGADVIQIEHPAQVAKWRAANPDAAASQALRERQSWRRNKRSLMLNPGHDAAAPVMRSLIESADVLIEDYRAGVFDAMGWGYAEAARINPKLVYCSISLAGRSGPYADRAGHDPVALALSGALSRLGNSATPSLPGLQVADVLAGAQATIGILAALQARSDTGTGRYIDCAMSDACMPLNVVTLARNADLDALGPPDGKWHPKGGVWECKDGQFLCTTDMEPAYWVRFCEVIDRPDLASQQQAVSRHEEMEREIAAIMKRRTRDEWAALLAAADTQVMPVFTLAEAVENEHNRARGMVMELPGRSSKVHQLAAPHGLGTKQGENAFPAAQPGEHTEEILGELGFDHAALRGTGALGN